MKINAKSQLGIRFSQDKLFANNILKDHLARKKKEWNDYKNVANKEEYEDSYSAHIEAMKEMFTNTLNKNYLITNTVHEVADKIKINLDKFDPKMLSCIPNDQKITFMLGVDNMFKYWKCGDQIFAIFINYIHEITWLDYVFFRIDTKKGIINFNDNQTSKNAVTKFLKLMFFVELSDPELKILPSGRKLGKTRKDKIINEDNYDVTIVDSTWNQMIIRDEKFGVSGHIRLQPCGKGFSQIKLKYIAPYVKDGYIRKVKKALV